MDKKGKRRRHGNSVNTIPQDIKTSNVIDIKTLVDMAERDTYTQAINVEDVKNEEEKLAVEKTDVIPEETVVTKINNADDIVIDKQKVKFHIPFNFVFAYIGLGLMFLIFFVVGIILYTLSSKTSILSTFNYQENGNSTWKVYYNAANSWYDGAVSSDYRYVRNFTNIVKTKLNYGLSFSDPVSTSYTYYVKSTISIYGSDNTDQVLWDNSEYLVPVTTSTSDNVSIINYVKEVEVDYQKYYQEYLSYKQAAGVSSDARIIIEFGINSSSTCDKLDKPVEKSSKMFVYIPLNEQSFAITSGTSIDATKQTIYNIDYSDSTQVKEKIFAYVSFALDIIIIIGLIAIRVYQVKTSNIFVRTFNKIVNSYDNVIVNVNELPDLTDKNVIEVSSFEELMDAQMEVRYPISCLETIPQKEAVFVLVQDDLAWKFILKEKDLKKKKN